MSQERKNATHCHFKAMAALIDICLRRLLSSWYRRNSEYRLTILHFVTLKIWYQFPVLISTTIDIGFEYDHPSVTSRRI